MRTMTFVIMGEEYTCGAGEGLTLSDVRRVALNETYNTGRPPEDFDVRDEAGNLLDPDTNVMDLPEGRFWMSPFIGCGG